MKIRTGFVSNSSSSSFVAWGVSKDEIPLPEDIMIRLFDEKLVTLENMKNNDLDRFNRWYRNEYSDMLDCKTDEEKIEYANDNLDANEIYEVGDFTKGGPENDFVGISPDYLMDHYPELKLGEVKKFIADKMNKVFGTNFTEKDIDYYEEGWMDN